MANEGSGNVYAGALLFAAGVLFGVTVVYFVLKPSQTAAPASAAVQQPYILAVPHTQGAEVELLYAEIRKLRRENEELREALRIAVPRGAVIPETKPEVVHAPAVMEKPVTIQNEENWHFKKDSKGKITGLAIKRRVTRE